MPLVSRSKRSAWAELNKQPALTRSKKFQTQVFIKPISEARDLAEFPDDRLLFMSLIRQLICVVCLAASTLAGASGPPNIILITLDTVRADRMGFLGSTRGLTPNLDALARQSVVFTRAYSQVPLTTPSHAAILTGTYPQFNQVDDFQVPLAKELPYAPEILRNNGYGTAAFLASMVLDPKSKFAPGFDRGFDTYDANFHMRAPNEDRYHSTERRGDEVVAHALAWLDEARSKHHPQGPLFVWVHLYDAHHPYEPPQPYRGKYAKVPYDGGIAYVDSVVGRFLTQLRARGLYDGSLIAVMADHGEALGEHGEDTHGIFLYDETIHVPLVIKLPGAASREKFEGRQVDARVQLVDVLPTILAAVGVAIPQEVQGKSLLGLMIAKPEAPGSVGPASEVSPDRPAYAETDYPRRAYGWSPLRALRTGKYLYVRAPRPELYDQSTDPNAGHDLSATSTAIAGTLAGQLDAFRQKTSSSKEAPKAAADPDAMEKLAALGYAATDPNASKRGANGNDVDADPKDKIEIANISSRANTLRQNGRCSEAVPLLRQLIAKEPDITPSFVKLGQCLITMKEYAEAATVLRELLKSYPGMTSSRFQLGMALLAAGDLDAAVKELEIVADKEPRWDKPHLALATTYAQTDREREAVTQCEEVLEVNPNHYVALLLEGRILVSSEHSDAALPRLENAANLRPEMPEPHIYLADAYDRLGRKKDAARERSLADRLAKNADGGAKSKD
jgi:choline-sulfatase